jgi:hypothetical protein
MALPDELLARAVTEMDDRGAKGLSLGASGAFAAGDRFGVCRLLATSDRPPDTGRPRFRVLYASRTLIGECFNHLASILRGRVAFISISALAER